MNKWFADTFLPSVFERCVVGKPKWLSQKQTAICVRYMDESVVRYDADGYGTMCNHLNYSCRWDGRSVTLSYSKKNGCGEILFGFNSSEIEVMKREYEAERARIKEERIQRTKSNPDRLAKKIASLTKAIAGWQAEYELDLSEGDEEQALLDLDEIAKLQAELTLYRN
jgi:hypothetical protein